ncbi:MAG TPA: PaaX family transcriptional regulator C-terminal domain-containing protein [Micromonosporaceae bacterium]
MAQPAQPRALIVTVYGLYARERGGWLPVSGLVRLLAGLGVDEPAVRSAISRLKHRGLLVAARRDGAAGYALSPTAVEILDEGDLRIFTPPSATLADGWLLATFSVPEAERSRRHTLRSTLSGLGFGTVAPGVWIAPAHRADLTRSALRRRGLDPYVHLFRADYLAYGDVQSLAERWWDLPAVGRYYAEFVAGWAPVLDGWGRDPGSAARAYRDWVLALTAWRRLPYLDPVLPGELLPADWPGKAAVDVFQALAERLAEPAARYVADVLGDERE